MIRISSIAMIVSLVILAACNNNQPSRDFDEDEEQRIFEMVAGPSSEGEYDRSIQTADSILKTELSDSLRGYIMSERCVALVNKGDLARGAAYADTLSRFGETNHISEIIYNAESAMGVCHRREQRYDSAIYHYKKGLKLAVDEKDPENEALLPTCWLSPMSRWAITTKPRFTTGGRLNLPAKAETPRQS